MQDILSICPAAMGSGIHSLLAETDSAGRLRVRAVARIKLLLERVKQNIKVSEASAAEESERDSGGGGGGGGGVCARTGSACCGGRCCSYALTSVLPLYFDAAAVGDDSQRKRK